MYLEFKMFNQLMPIIENIRICIYNWCVNNEFDVGQEELFEFVTSSDTMGSVPLTTMPDIAISGLQEIKTHPNYFPFLLLTGLRLRFEGKNHLFFKLNTICTVH